MKTAVLGASGLVGRTMLRFLAEREWVDEPPLCLTSARSAGTELPFRDGAVVCRDAAAADWSEVRVALFSAGGATARRYGPVARAAGAWVVDNSSAFRLDPDVPLVVPEINPALVPDLHRDVLGGGIIANPNCSTIQIAVAVAPLDRAFGLREVHATTFQSVSGAGQRALDVLARELERGEGGASPAGEVFPRAIALNAIPEIGPALADGSFEEEAKVGRELRKILDRPDLAVTCTAVRVAVRVGHGAALRVLLERPVTPEDARAALGNRPGLDVADGPHEYLTPLEIAGQTVVHVGRLRRDPTRDDALLLWVVADNLLKGAAWNAVQIADLLVGAR